MDTGFEHGRKTETSVPDTVCHRWPVSSTVPQHGQAGLRSGHEKERGCIRVSSSAIPANETGLLVGEAGANRFLNGRKIATFGKGGRKVW